MTPGARVSAAIEILQKFLDHPGGLIDPLLRDWARGARYAGSKDRAGVADLVFSALRRLGSARLGAASPDARAAVLGALRLEGGDVAEIEALCDGGPHRPPPLSQEEKDRLQGLPDMALSGRAADFPDWLLPALEASVAAPEAEIAALAGRAALDLRVNLLKGDVEAARAALAQDGLNTEPGPYAPTALRGLGFGVADRPKLSRLGAYADGLVEPQDAASQAIALLAASLFSLAGGEGALLDACAGGGGKSLAMAAAVEGRVHAFDVAPGRMKDLPDRAARAGACIEILDRSGLEALSGRCDLVLADAPCSGSGAWSRQPDAKWRLTPKRLAELQSMQAEALALSAQAVRPGGMLVYATCSLLRQENDDSVARFLKRFEAFEPVDVDAAWRAAGLADRPPASTSCPGKCDFPAASVLFPPSFKGTDGFYVAALRRRSGR